MNYYSFIAFLVLGFFFIYSGIDWLGLLFLALALMVILYNPAKDTLDKAWKEVDKADGSNPSAKFVEYSAGAAKAAADNVYSKKGTIYNSREWLHKSPSMSKNFFSELEKIFK